MKKFLVAFVKDPLCHLLLIGAVVYVLTQPTINTVDNSKRIHVTPEFIEQLKQQFHHTYLRHPNPQEQKLLIDNAVMDLALYREGLEYNLDRADEVVKRRIIQKMNFIIEGMAKPGSPDMDDLAIFLKENQEQFLTPEQYSFEHRFISGHSEIHRQKATSLMTALQSGDLQTANISGDYFLRGEQFNSLSANRINSIFGKRFAQYLDNKPEGQWLGPFPSTYGFHAVRIKRVTPSRIPKLIDVRDQVYTAWHKAQTEANITNIKQKLLGQYQIDIASDDSPNDINNKVESTQHVAFY